MKIALQMPWFTWPGGAVTIGPKLAEIAKTAEAAGYDSLWVMDHFFQIPNVGPVENDMLEAYTTLGYLAGVTNRVGLGTLVTGVTYRNPGVLVKQVTTLDVLSRGRAWMGIGAAWFEREHNGLGVPFPPLKERFQRLEDQLLIAKQMWSGDRGAFAGKHYQLAETMNVPAPIQQPHPRILIGGGGEKKTLRFVAKYGNACHVFGDPATVKHKLGVLREHCEREGRDYDSILKCAGGRLDTGTNGDGASKLVDLLGQYAEAGAQMMISATLGYDTIRPLEIMGRDVIPQVASL